MMHAFAPGSHPGSETNQRLSDCAEVYRSLWCEETCERELDITAATNTAGDNKPSHGACSGHISRADAGPAGGGAGALRGRGRREGRAL